MRVIVKYPPSGGDEREIKGAPVAGLALLCSDVLPSSKLGTQWML